MATSTKHDSGILHTWATSLLCLFLTGGGMVLTLYHLAEVFGWILMIVGGVGMLGVAMRLYGTRKQPKATPAEPEILPAVVLMPLVLAEVFVFGRIDIVIRNHNQSRSFALLRPFVKNDLGQALPCTIEYKGAEFSGPRWIAPGDGGMRMSLFVEALKHDKQARRLVHVCLEIEGIPPVLSGEQAVPPNMIT